MSEAKKRVTRVALRPETEKILEGWRTQLIETYPTFNPSDRILIEWAVDRTTTLSKKNIQEIKDRYFDEVKELENLLCQLRKASGNPQLRDKLLESTSLRRKIAKNKNSTPVVETHKSPQKIENRSPPCHKIPLFP